MYKIYKLSSAQTNLCYIGITSQKYLSTRHRQHCYNMRSNKPYCGAYSIVRFNDSVIELLKEVSTKYEALEIETAFIQEHEHSTNVLKKRTFQINN